MSHGVLGGARREANHDPLRAPSTATAPKSAPTIAFAGGGSGGVTMTTGGGSTGAASAGPASDVPASDVPESDMPESDVPESDAPESDGAPPSEGVGPGVGPGSVAWIVETGAGEGEGALPAPGPGLAFATHTPCWAE